MDEFNAQINDAPARKSDAVRTVKVHMFDKNKNGMNDKDVYMTKETRTSATIKKHGVVFNVASGRMCYRSNNCTSWCCSQESRLNTERAYFKRNHINKEIREAFE
jgi:Tfp pilus assembly protein PilV